jgi:hypothetical protein
LEVDGVERGIQTVKDVIKILLLLIVREGQGKFPLLRRAGRVSMTESLKIIRR